MYCLEALGIDSGWNSLEELGALYVADMRAFQPEGPYHLLGASFGGMVIYEVARQLRAQGLEVGLVGLLDSFNIGDRNLKTRWERFNDQMGFISRRVQAHTKRLLARRLSEWPGYIGGRFLSIGRILERVIWRVVYRSYKAPVSKRPSVLRNQTRVYHIAGMDYVPKPYPGKLVLFRGQRKTSKAIAEMLRKNQYGWKGLAGGGLEIIDVPGDHHTMMQEPHVSVLAGEITNYLERYAAQRCAPAEDTGLPTLASSEQHA